MDVSKKIGFTLKTLNWLMFIIDMANCLPTLALLKQNILHDASPETPSAVSVDRHVW